MLVKKIVGVKQYENSSQSAREKENMTVNFFKISTLENKIDAHEKFKKYTGKKAKLPVKKCQQKF